jgi:hypothetical protein
LKQRAALAAALTSLVLAGCGGNDSGTCTTNPAAAIRSTPPTVATVGVQYTYVADAIYSCILGACGAINAVALPPGASVSRDAVIWTPPASAANTSTAFAISTRSDLCGNRASQSWNVQVHPRPVIESFSASPDRVNPGEAVALTAVFQGRARIEELAGFTPASGVPVPTPPLNVDSRFTLVVVNDIGFETRQSIVVDVQTAPAIASFAASPAVIGSGGSSTLQWSVTGDVRQARIEPLGVDVVTGSGLVVTPTQTTTYTLQLSNDVGASASSSVEVRVVPPGAIDSFAATPASTVVGGSVTLGARFTGTGSVERDDGNGSFTTLGPISSDGQLDSGPLYRSTQFRLVARNEVGVAVTRDIIVSLTGPGTFEVITSPSLARARHSATRLADGRVFIAGGGPLATEIFDPATQTFAAGPNLLATREGHSATLLADGRVLLVGGFVNRVVQISPEIYDPASDTLTALTGPPGRSYSMPSALLPDGRVMFGATTSTSGSFNPNGVYLFDPAAGSFSPFIRYQNGFGLVDAMEVLGDGRVLAVQPNGASELFTPGADAFSTTGAGLSRGIEPASALLQDGRVLVVGGSTLAAAEVYDSATGQFAMAGQQSFFASNSRAVTLASGAVLVVGGSNALSTGAELFDPGTGAFTRTGGTRRGRSSHTATRLQDGRVLVIGGCIMQPCEAEIYTP